MVTSGCRYDFSDIDKFLRDIPKQVENVCKEVGEKAVDYAKEHGSYHDVTGHLRASNKYRADNEGLVVYNEADYASDVESRGYEVTSGAALYAEQLLKEKCER